jgi:hypothetical protein
MNEVKKIDIHFEDGTKKTVTSQGVAVWIDGNDAEMNFCNMDTKDVPLLLKAIEQALKIAKAQSDIMGKRS